MKKIRLIIADDHTLLRMGLTTLFKYQPDMTVVGQAEDGEGAVTPTFLIIGKLEKVLDGTIGFSASYGNIAA